MWRRSGFSEKEEVEKFGLFVTKHELNLDISYVPPQYD